MSRSLAVRGVEPTVSLKAVLLHLLRGHNFTLGELLLGTSPQPDSAITSWVRGRGTSVPSEHRGHWKFLKPLELVLGPKSRFPIPLRSPSSAQEGRAVHTSEDCQNFLSWALGVRERARTGCEVMALFIVYMECIFTCPATHLPTCTHSFIHLANIFLFQRWSVPLAF